jgi:hypothetical protein
MDPNKARILIACMPQAYTRLFAILAGHELSFATTLGDAQIALNGDRFDMIMVGVHFDESKMFDLLQVVKADGRQGQARLVCFRGIEAESDKSRILEANCQAACEAMDAAFFDLAAFADDTHGNDAVRQIIRGLLLAESPAAGQSARQK